MVYAIGVGTDEDVRIQQQGYTSLNEAVKVAKAQKAHGIDHIRIFKLIKTKI